MSIPTMGKAAIARAVWIAGTGAYASVSHCDGSISIERHETIRAAEDAKRFMDNAGCCGNCTRAHNVARMP